MLLLMLLTLPELMTLNRLQNPHRLVAGTIILIP
jgi:hypothetical protein